MVNTAKIKGRMAEKGFTNRKMARTVKLSEFSFRKQLKNEVPMRLDTAKKMQTELNITDEEFPEFFLI